MEPIAPAPTTAIFTAGVVLSEIGMRSYSLPKRCGRWPRECSSRAFRHECRSRCQAPRTTSRDAPAPVRFVSRADLARRRQPVPLLRDRDQAAQHRSDPGGGVRVEDLRRLDQLELPDPTIAAEQRDLARPGWH